MDNIKPFLDSLSFAPMYAVECGAAHPTTSQIRDYISLGVKCRLFEPNPRLFHCLYHGWDDDNFINTWPTTTSLPHKYDGFGHLPNVQLHNVALGDHSGFSRMYECNASSFIDGISSPATVNDNFSKVGAKGYLVRTETFDKYDDGTINLLVADVEGSEWFIIKHMVSRPTLICLETHGGNYRNPYLDQINKWMEINNYERLASNDSDTFWGLRSKMIVDNTPVRS